LPQPDSLLATKLNEAVVLFERAIKINPDNWSAMWFIGKVYQRFGDMNEALRWFERSYQINPSHADIAREVSICAMGIGRRDTAITFAYRATQIESTNPGLQANLALAYLTSGRISDARIAIERALAGDPRDVISQNIRAMVEHFAITRNVPPATIPGLLSYWASASPKRRRLGHC